MKPGYAEVFDSLDVALAVNKSPIGIDIRENDGKWGVHIWFKNQNDARPFIESITRLGEPLRKFLIHGQPDRWIHKKDAWVYSVCSDDYRGR